jgi:hypothetical protein
MTWSFAGPDGRATFEWVVRDGEARIRWRRIGGHAVFDRLAAASEAAAPPTPPVGPSGPQTR